ncbi:BP80, partial [Symbiodinium microadriaticum]
MDFWMSSGDRLATKFLEKFKPYAVALSEHLQFAPRYDIFKPDEGMLGESNSELCVSADSESFCAPDPDGGGPVTGEDVVNEDVRQLCLWNVTARRGGTTGALFSEPYWLYVVSFNRRCSVRAHDADHRFGEVCSLSVMRDIGIDAQSVQDCVHRNRVPILREQLKNVAWSRLALQLNGWRYSGPLDPQTVLQAVCGGYTTPPEECSTLQKGLPP